MLDKIRKYREYLIFIIITCLFVITVIYAGIIYFRWDKVVNEMAEEVEVSLPIIDWEGYSELSKQYENDIIEPL